MKMNWPKVFWLRITHGVIQAKKTTDAKTTPAKDRLPRFARRIQAHNPAAGRKDSREVLLNAVIPHSSPNSTQGSQPSRSSKFSVSQTMDANRNAARLFSQTSPPPPHTQSLSHT